MVVNEFKKVVRFGIPRRWGNSYKKYAVVVRNNFELKDVMNKIEQLKAKFLGIDNV